MGCCSLVDYCYSRRDEKEPEFFKDRNRYVAEQDNFSKIPGSPVAYWVQQCVIHAFQEPLLSAYGDTSKGIITGDNARFLKMWHEIPIDEIGFNTTNYIMCEKSDTKWYPCNKGGEYRKWYGNNTYIIDWWHNGYEVMQKGRTKARNCQDYADVNKFVPSVTWSSLSSGAPSFRFSDMSLSESAGMTLFPKTISADYCLSYLNTKVADYFLKVINPTLNYTAGSISTLPIKKPDCESEEKIETLSSHSVSISKSDWDSFETSWDFKRHPLV